MKIIVNKGTKNQNKKNTKTEKVCKKNVKRNEYENKNDKLPLQTGLIH